MDDQRVGRIVRALRRRLGWRQSDLARHARCSQNLVSLIERGHLDRVSLRTIKRVMSALDAWVVMEVRWRGPALDRMLDEGHAAVVGAVAEVLRRAGWLVEIEVTYSEFGERGSIDILAFMPSAGVLLVIEVKTDLPSAEATLRKLDEKCRLASEIAAKRFGWSSRTVARLLVAPASRTLRRRVDRHAALFDRTLPARTIDVRRWIRSPRGALAGIWFVTDRDAGVGISGAKAKERIRVPKPVLSTTGSLADTKSRLAEE